MMSKYVEQQGFHHQQAQKRVKHSSTSVFVVMEEVCSVLAELLWEGSYHRDPPKPKNILFYFDINFNQITLGEITITIQTFRGACTSAFDSTTCGPTLPFSNTLIPAVIKVTKFIYFQI